MNAHEPRKQQPAAGDAVRVDLTVEHQECWLIEVSSETDVGILGRGVYRTDDGRATSHVTLVGDERAELDEAIVVARASGHTFSVAELNSEDGFTPRLSAGKARRELLVKHDPSKQVSDSFTSRGFIYGAPVDIRDGVEHWTLVTLRDRQEIQAALDEVRDAEAAEIDLIGISGHENTAGEGELPLKRLSRRQREVFELARHNGYYSHPKQTTVGELAVELGVSTSTIHEHLQKAEQALLDLSSNA